MAKMTVEQALAAIQAAETESAINAVFEECTKTQIHEVFLGVTYNKDELVSKSWKKEDLVSYYTARTMVFKASEAFKKMDAEAKAEHILDFDHVAYNSDLDKVLSSCSLYELLVIASKLGVSVKEVEARCKADWNDAASGLRLELKWFISRNAENAKTLKTEAAVEEASAVVEGQSEQAAVVAQCKGNEVATMTKWEKKQCAKARAKANSFFRTMDNRQIAFALELYREAMAWAETQDFSSKPYIRTTRDKVEEWVSSYEVQEAKDLYDGWIDYLDHYSRVLNVKMKGHRGFDEPTNCDEEDSLVQSITDRVALIGSDPRAIECEKAYHEELEAAHQAAMKKIEEYIQAANGGLIEYTTDLGWEIIHSCSNYDDEKAVRKAMAEYNCEVLSQYRTCEELTAAIMQTQPNTIAQTLYWLTGQQIGKNIDARDANKFADWYMASEYYRPEQEVTVKDTASSTKQAQSEVPVVTEAPVIEPVQSEQPDSYEIGKRIVSLKGKAKAQQALVQECGEEFLLNMYFVFPNAAPIRITMEEPEELVKYLCRAVLRVVRDAEYTRILLRDARIFLNGTNPNKNDVYLKGWIKFLEDYTAPLSVKSTHEDVAAAYCRYAQAEDEASIEELRKEYLQVLSEYRMTAMPERQRILATIREYHRESVYDDAMLSDEEWLLYAAHSCGIALPRQCVSRVDIAIKLYRMANIDTGELTAIEEVRSRRKELQRELHGMWLTRRVILEGQKALYSEQKYMYSDILSQMWGMNQREEASTLLSEYADVNRKFSVELRSENLLIAV